MSHSPPRGYGLVNTFDLPGDEEDVDTKICCSTRDSTNDRQSDHRSSDQVSTNSMTDIPNNVPSSNNKQHEYSEVPNTDLNLPTLIREISIDSPKTPKISPRQRKSTNVPSNDIVPPPPIDHEYHVVPSSDPELHILPPIQISRNQEQHSVIMLPNQSPKSAMKFHETYGYFPGQQVPQEHNSCCGYVYVLLFTFMVLIAILLLISSSPNVPIIQLDSLSVVKINATRPRDSKLEIKGMWDFQLTIKNPENKWRGMFHSVNCTMYKQLETKAYYEEDPKNLYQIGNASSTEGFSLDPGAGKESQFELEVEETQDLEGATFVLWVAAYVSFDRSRFQWYSGNVNYNSGPLTINQDTGTLANSVPVRCKFTFPLL